MKSEVVFITGASSGIGMETAILLRKKGFEVFAGARRTEKMQFLQQSGIHILELDISRKESIQSAVDHIIKKAGRIDILINNAGFGLTGAFEQTSIDEGRYQMEVNFFGMADLIHLVIP